ncbi:hypothetical protein ACFQXA_02055 [Nocardiopsis composta]
MPGRFASDGRQVTEWSARTEFTGDRLTSLMAEIDEAGDPDTGVETWPAESEDAVASWTQEEAG